MSTTRWCNARASVRAKSGWSGWSRSLNIIQFLVGNSCTVLNRLVAAIWLFIIVLFKANLLYFNYRSGYLIWYLNLQIIFFKALLPLVSWLRQSSDNWHIKQFHRHCTITRRETWHSGEKHNCTKGKKIHILSPKWGLQNRLYPAQWARLNFHLCLHFEANSLRLLSVVLGFDNLITSFSCKHRSHRRAPFLYA